MSDNDAFEDEEPIAVWESLFLPNWKWEAYEVDDVSEDRGRTYFGQVKSPNTYGNWEAGYFTDRQLTKAGAYRIDE
jgi:hypothetical protein